MNEIPVLRIFLTLVETSLPVKESKNSYVCDIPTKQRVKYVHVFMLQLLQKDAE